MKKYWILAMGLTFVGVSIAEEVPASGKVHPAQFLGQRPYAQAPLANKPAQAYAPWEGTALIVNPEKEAIASEKRAHPNQMRLHFISKRPYGDMHTAE